MPEWGPGSRTLTQDGFGVARDIRVTTAGLPWYTLKSLAYPQYNTGFPGARDGSSPRLPVERGGVTSHLPHGYPPWGSVRSPPAVPVAYRGKTPFRHHHGAMTPPRGGYMPNPSSPLARAHMRGVSCNETMKAMKVSIQRTNKTIKPGAGFTRAQRR